MKKILALALVFSCGPLCGETSSANASASSIELSYQRIAGMVRLWGQAKYFHPQLAEPSSTGWDEAFVQTLPKVRDASSEEQYATALQEMLDRLEDPLTRILNTLDQPETAPGVPSDFVVKTTGDGILSISVGDYYALWGPSAQKQIGQVLEEVSSATGVVLDLRSSQSTETFGRVQLSGALDGLIPHLTDRPMQTPGAWRRVYYGYESATAYSSGQYRTGVVVENGRRVEPAVPGHNSPTVVLVNRHSGLPTTILALQASGQALIVYEGDLEKHTIGTVATIDVVPGLAAQVRTSTPSFADGKSGAFQPDFVVPEGNAPSGTSALDRSIDLARNFDPPVGDRPSLPIVVAPTLEEPYAEMQFPSLEYRLLAAARIWNVVNHFYPYKNLLDEDWNDVLLRVLPLFEAASNAREYTLAVVTMARALQDSHAYVAGSTFYEQVLPSGYPPIRVRRIENSFLVASLWDEELARVAGVAVGDELLAIDGQSVADRWNDISNLLSTSTPQSLLDRGSLALLAGPVGSQASLLVRREGGTPREAVIERRREDYSTLYHRERTREVFEKLPGNITYVDLDRLDYGMLEPMFELLLTSSSAIFDMRGYPHGTIWALAPHLTKKRSVAAVFRTPMLGHRSPEAASEIFEQVFEPAEPYFGGRTVMLMDGRTMSQAEHTGLYLKAANNTTFVGSQTAGANGEIAVVTVPGGMALGFTGQDVRLPDGTALQRSGLTPDIEVHPTVSGVRSGRDEVLEAAIRFLSEAPNTIPPN